MALDLNTRVFVYGIGVEQLVKPKKINRNSQGACLIFSSVGHEREGTKPERRRKKRKRKKKRVDSNTVVVQITQGTPGTEFFVLHIVITVNKTHVLWGSRTRAAWHRSRTTIHKTSQAEKEEARRTLYHKVYFL